MDFNTLFYMYHDKVFRLCMGYVNDKDAAQDLVQETFISVWKNLSRFRNESSIGTWIFRIATNNCLRSIERNKRIPKERLTVQIEDKTEQNSELNMNLLYRFISELTEIDRIIIGLELEEVRQSEIAKITGLSESNIRVKIHRIKKILSKKFKDYERAGY